MIIRLIPSQISIFWDAIRHSVLQSNSIPVDKSHEYSKRLLIDILSGRSQTWLLFGYKEIEKEIHGVAVTEIIEDKQGISILMIKAIYVFRPTPDEIYADGMEELKKFGRNSGCKEICTFGKSTRVFDLLDRVWKFNMTMKQYTLEL